MAELNLVSKFRFDPPLSVKAEIALLKRPGIWAPTTADFQAVAGPSAVVCSSFLQALGVIAKKPLNSVDRVNIFTHGNKDLIAFNGRVTPGTVSTDVWFDQPEGDMSHMSSRSLATIRDPSKYFLVDGAKRTLADLKARFTKTAVIFIYSCKSGTDGAFLQDVADTFKVMVVNGFSVKIAYCPRFTESTIDRKHVAVADVSDPCTGSKSVSNSYYTLAPFAAARGMIVSRKPR